MEQRSECHCFSGRPINTPAGIDDVTPRLDVRAHEPRMDDHVIRQLDRCERHLRLDQHESQSTV